MDIGRALSGPARLANSLDKTARVNLEKWSSAADPERSQLYS